MFLQSTVFEKLKEINERQQEYWSAREIAKILEYKDYRNFEKVLEKAEKSCKNAGQSIKKHFVGVTDMIELAKNGSREIEDVHLSRYACYLVMQNADPSYVTLVL